MTGGGDARTTVLASIRQSLAASTAHDAVHAEIHHPAPRPGSLPVVRLQQTGPVSADPPAAPAAPTPLEAFIERLHTVGGQSTVVADEAAAARAVGALLAEHDVGRVAASDSALVARLLPAAAPAGVEVMVDPDADALFGCDAGVTAAQWGIAETGSLVLESRAERHRLTSLIPPLHIAVLHAERILGTLGDALARVRGDAAEVPSHAITLITGPSRTADIELTLAIGVHGPQALHVIVIDSAG